MKENISLKKKTINGVFWSSVDNISSQGISFVFSIILARLLLPSDYGTIAVLTVFLAISQTFVNSGFSQALIRKLDRSEEDFSTTFYFNIVVGFFCYIVLFYSSPLIASFFNNPSLISIVKVISLIVIFNSLSVVQQAHLLIRVDFKTQALISLIAVLSSGAIGVGLAYLGFEVWSLVYQQVSFAAIKCVLLWIFVAWKPTKKFSKKSFRSLFSFGSKLLISGMLDTVWNNLYEIIIGKYFNASSLGLYSRAKTFAAFPSSNFTSIFQRVTFPVLSSIQNDVDRLRNNYRKIIRLVAFIVFPIMLMMCALAKPFILFLLTDKWSGSIILLQWLCLSFMWYPINMINMNLLQVIGRTDLYLKIEIIKKIIGAIALIVSIPFGITAMCIANFVITLIFIFINTYYTGKYLNFGFIEQMRDIMPSLLTSSFTSLVVGYIVALMDISNFMQLLLGASIGIILYGSIAKLFNMPEFKELFNIIKYKDKI